MVADAALRQLQAAQGILCGDDAATDPAPSPPPARPVPDPSEERARLADEGRTTRRIAIAAIVVALLAVGLAVVAFAPAGRQLLPAGVVGRPARRVADLPPATR